MKNIWLALSALIWLTSCEVKPQAIHYGADGCSFCKMTIVDKQHAAQLVTTKGKSFKYDAIECMMNHLNKWDQAPVSLYLVTDYSQPELLIDAKQAYYLVDENIPSPMGAHLSAFKKKADLKNTMVDAKAMMMDWGQLEEGFK